MASSTLADGISFVAASSGTGTFVFGASRTSYLTLAQAQSAGEIADGNTVSYLALDSLSNPAQREWGHGTYSLSGNSIARTTVLGTVNGNTPGTGSALNFSVAPTIFLTALAEDLGCLPVYVAPANTAISVTSGPGSVGTPNASPLGLYAGAGHATGGVGGAINIKSGAGSGANAGSINITGADGPVSGNYYGGNVKIKAGAGTGYSGGTVYLNGGAGGKYGGGVNMDSGSGSGAGSKGGTFYMLGGSGVANGGKFIIQAGSTTTGTGGYVSIIAGGATTGAAGFMQLYGGATSAGTGNGGNVTIKPGTSFGGTNGRLLIKNLPTSSAGLTAGMVWNNAGVLSIV